MNEAKVQQAMEQAMASAKMTANGTIELPVDEWTQLVTSVIPLKWTSHYDHGNL